MIKVGRYTAAALLVIIGVLLLIDQATGSSWLGYAVKWWPGLLIALGIEYLIFSVAYQKGDRKLKLDTGGVFFAVLISAIVIGAMQGGKLSLNWMSFDFAGKSGQKFEKPVTSIPLAANTDRIVLHNDSGDIIVKPAAIDHIEIQATVWVNKSDSEAARGIADKSGIVYKEGGTLQIDAKGEPYSGQFVFRRTARMDLIVTVPDTRKLDYEFETRNSEVRADQLAVSGKLKLSTTNDSVTVSNITGNVEIHTTNASVRATHIAGEADLNSTNGSITAEGIEGKLSVDTSNAKVTVTDAAAAVEAKTTNGSIETKTRTVGGDWNLRTSNASIKAKMPANGDYSVEGSTTNGGSETDLPLSSSGNRLEGKIGSGKFDLKLRTTNNHISVMKAD